MKLGKSPMSNKKRSDGHSRASSGMGSIDEEEAGAQQPGRPQIDPCLIMDDIIEKLQLLDYKAKFCASRKHKPMSRTYFAIQTGQEEGGESKVA